MRTSRLVLVISAAAAALGVFAWQALAPNSFAQSEGFAQRSDWEKEYEGVPQIWIEATLIQIDTTDLDKVKSSLGNSLDPLTGKVKLTGEEKVALLAALKDRPSCEVLGSASLITYGGNQALMQMVEEVRYPTEYEGQGTQLAAGEGSAAALEVVVAPATFETREVGMRLNVTPNILWEDKAVVLVTILEVSHPAGYMVYGESKTFSQPVFTSWDLTTTLSIPDGQTLVFTNVPSKNFEQSQLLGAQQAEELKGKKSAIVLISAKIVGELNDR